MLRLLRIALQVVLFFLLLGVVVAIGSPDTGLAEKAAPLAAGAALVWAAARVRDLDRLVVRDQHAGGRRPHVDEP